MTDTPKLGPWECFRDASYYDMWCVRRVHDREFGRCFHLVQGDEAAALRDLLNTRVPTVDTHKPTPTAVADSAAADSVVNGGLVEAVAKELAREYLLVSDGHCRSVAKQILATAAPLIRAQIADWLVEQPPHLSLQEYADMICEGYW